MGIEISPHILIMKKVVDKKKSRLISDETNGKISKEYHYLNLKKVYAWNLSYCSAIKIVNTYKITNNKFSCFYGVSKIKILNYRKLSFSIQNGCNLKFFGKIILQKINFTNNHYFWLHNNKLKNINFEPIRCNDKELQNNHNIIITKQKINI